MIFVRILFLSVILLLILQLKKSFQTESEKIGCVVLSDSEVS